MGPPPAKPAAATPSPAAGPALAAPPTGLSAEAIAKLRSGFATINQERSGTFASFVMALTHIDEDLDLKLRQLAQAAIKEHIIPAITIAGSQTDTEHYLPLRQLFHDIPPSDPQEPKFLFPLNLKKISYAANISRGLPKFDDLAQSRPASDQQTILHHLFDSLLELARLSPEFARSLETAINRATKAIAD